MFLRSCRAVFIHFGMEDFPNVARIHLKTAKSCRSDKSASNFIFKASSAENILASNTFTDIGRPSISKSRCLSPELDLEITCSKVDKQHNRKDNNPGVQNTMRASVNTLLQARARQTRLHAIANRVAVVSYLKRVFAIC